MVHKQCNLATGLPAWKFGTECVPELEGTGAGKNAHDLGNNVDGALNGNTPPNTRRLDSQIQCIVSSYLQHNCGTRSRTQTTTLHHRRTATHCRTPNHCSWTELLGTTTHIAVENTADSWTPDGPFPHLL